MTETDQEDSLPKPRQQASEEFDNRDAFKGRELKNKMMVGPTANPFGGRLLQNESQKDERCARIRDNLVNRLRASPNSTYIKPRVNKRSLSLACNIDSIDELRTKC